MTPATFDYFRDIVRRRASIVLEAGKEYLVEARLSPIAKSEGLGSIDDLMMRVRSDERSRLATQIVEAMTTNETSFFRDAHPFEALKTTILPAMVKARAATKRLRIWCAAASTGQEPYSVAMTVLDHVPRLSDWSIDIAATDINASVLDKARAGTFKQLEVNRGLPARMLTTYFDRKGMDWQIKQHVRDMVKFSEFNLRDPFAPLGMLDIIFIRNVLIYFDLETKRSILTRLRRVLAPGGYVLLGGAETTLNIDDGYQPVRVGQTVVYQAKG